jgi:nicotinamidase-related amidase
MIRADRLEIDRALLLIVDVQEKLLPQIRHCEELVRQTVKLIQGMDAFGVPVMATEQYPQGLGSTEATVREALTAASAKVLEKGAFSSCGEEPIREALREVDRPQIVVTGIESHICVQQTVLDLRAMDYDVYVPADAVGSRTRLDYEISLDRMRQAGALVSTSESILFELCDRCDIPRFKALLPIIKNTPPAEW